MEYLLEGVEFSGSTDQLDLGDGWTLQRLTKEETISRAEHEVLSRHSATSPAIVRVVLIYRAQVGVELRDTLPEAARAFDLGAELHDRSQLIAALFHLIKDCRVQVIGRTPRYVPSVLPNAILSPANAREIAFTVSLAYALLGDPVDRSERFTKLYDLYGERSKIVHGSVPHGIAASAKHANSAYRASECLRDLIYRVLYQGVFADGKRSKKLWAEQLLKMAS